MNGPLESFMMMSLNRIGILSKSPRVSVLMTIYNAALFLSESIDSLMAQSFSDWELIAVENGSTDGSQLILAGYRDPRIRVFAFPKNIGRTPALAEALSKAKGEYIAILDADDAAYPHRLIRQVEFLDNNPEVILVGTLTSLIDAKGRVFGSWDSPTDSSKLYECLGWKIPFGHSSAMFRHQTAVLAGGYPLDYVHSQDFAMFLKLAQYGKLAIIGEYLCKIRFSSGSMTNSPQHAIDVACEGLRLLKYARENLSLGKRAFFMNRCSASRFEFRYGRALFSRGRIFLGLGLMVWGFLSFIVLKIRLLLMGIEKD